MSWPYSPAECPVCRYFTALDPPAYDDIGYEIIGGCRLPKIGMELFRFKERDPATMAACPCFSRSSPGATVLPELANATSLEESIRHRRRLPEIPLGRTVVRPSVCGSG